MAFDWTFDGMNNPVTVEPYTPIIDSTQLKEYRFKAITKNMPANKLLRMDRESRNNLQRQINRVCSGNVLRTVYTTGNIAKVLVQC